MVCHVKFISNQMSIKKSFIEYHNTHTHLRITTPTENLTRKRNKKKMKYEANSHYSVEDTLDVSLEAKKVFDFLDSLPDWTEESSKLQKEIRIREGWDKN